MAGGRSEGSPWRTDREPVPRSREELTEQVRGIERDANQYLNDHAEKFDPFRWGENIDERELRRKAFVEAGMTMLQAHGVDVGEANPAPALRQQLVEKVNDPRYHRLLRRKPLMVRLYGYPVVWADRTGNLDDPATSEAMSEILRREETWGKERVPFTTLDLWLIATLQGVDCPYDPHDILEFSCLENRPNIFRLDTQEMNPFTHDIMIYGGFGTGLVEDGPELPAPYDVGLPLRLGILRSLAEANYDIGLEFVVCGIMQRQVPVDLVRVWVSDLIEVVDRHGFVPRVLADVEDEPYPELSANPLDKKLGYLSQEELDWLIHNHANTVGAFVARWIQHDWEDFCSATESAGLAVGRYEVGDLYKLGEVIKSLSDYDLQQAARQLQALSGSPVTEAYPAVFDAIVSFLRDQRRSDGTFGYTPDERTRFRSQGLDDEMFERRIVEPTTEACERALEELDVE